MGGQIERRRSALLLSFLFDSSGMTFLLIRDSPAVGVTSPIAALVCWIVLVRTARRLRVTGL